MRIKEDKNLSRVIIWQTCSSFLLQGIGLITAPIYTRILSPEDYGQTSTFSSWVSIVGLIVGLQVGGTVGIAKGKYSNEEYRKYCSSVMWLSFISFVAALLFFIVFSNELSGILGFPVYLVPLIVINSYVSFVISFCNSIMEFDFKIELKTIISIILSVTSISLSFVFVLNMSNDKYIGKIIGSLIPMIVIATIEFFVVMSRGKSLFSVNYWKFCLPLSIPLIFHAAGGTILAQSDRIMLKSMVGEAETGIYSVVYTLATIVDVLWTAFNHSWVPFYYDYKKRKDVKQILQKSNGYLFTFTIITIGFMLCAPEVFKILAPENYWGGLSIIPLVSTAYYLNFMYSFPANHEFYNQNTKMISISTVMSAVLNIVLNYLLIPTYHGVGAAVATVISYLFCFIFHDIAARFIIGDFEYSWKFYFRGLIPVVIYSALYYVLMPYAIPRWIVACILGVILVCKMYKRRSIF